jgi:hypothetical protein
MKCVEKDRARRYATASALEMDIRRYLSDELVEASPPSWTYRLRKLTRKYRGPLRAAAAMAMLLMAATIFSSWQAVRANRAHAIAVAQKQRADHQATTATRITESLQQILGLVDPDAAKPPDYTVRQLIDEYAENLEAKLGDQPEAAANLHATIGRSYACWGEREKAKRHLTRALFLSRRIFGEKHDKYADVLVEYGRPDASDPVERPEREADLRRALAIYRARGVGGERVIRALWTLQWNLKEQGIAGASEKWSQYELVLEESVAEASKFPGAEFPKMASIHSALSGIEVSRSDYAVGERTARLAVAMHLKLHGPDSLETAWGYLALSDALRPQGKLAEGMAAQIQGVNIMRNSLPAEHANIAYALAAVIKTLDQADDTQTLAALFPSLAKAEEVELVFREVVEKTKPSTLRYDDPAFVAANGLTRIVESYLDLRDEWNNADQATEAEKSRQNALLLLKNLEAVHARGPELFPEFARFRTAVRARAM